MAPPKRLATTRALATLLTCWLTVEIVAYLGLVYLDKNWSPASVSRSQAQRWLKDTTSTAVPSDGNVPAWVEHKFPHPYLGAAAQSFDAAMQPLPKKSKDNLVVGIFGGSVARQIATDGGLELRSKLAKIFAVKDVRIVNLTGGGFKEPQQLMALSYFLAQGGELDLALSLDGFNEVAMHGVINDKDGVHPSYPYGWKNRAAKATTSKMTATIGQRELARERLSQAALNATKSWAMLPSAQIYYRLKILKLAERWQDAGKALLAVPVVIGPPFQGDPYPALVDTWLQSTVQMEKMCQANGIAFYEFLQPNQYAPISKPMSDEEKSLAVNLQGPYAASAKIGYPLLIAAGPSLRKSGVNFTDLVALFQNTQAPVYSDDCCHFNALGVQKLVEAIVDSVAKKH